MPKRLLANKSAFSSHGTHDLDLGTRLMQPDAENAFTVTTTERAHYTV